jgi:hypothetical protein
MRLHNGILQSKRNELLILLLQVQEARFKRLLSNLVSLHDILEKQNPSEQRPALWLPGVWEWLATGQHVDRFE